MALPWLELVFAPRADDAGDGRGPEVTRRDRCGSANGAADDRAVVERIRAGDVDAYERLFRAHYAELTGFAEHLLGAHDAAEDVVQGVLWEVWEHRDRLDPARPVRAYLFAAVRNRTRNARRDSALAAQRAWESAVEANLHAEAWHDDDRREALGVVTRALETLVARDREVLLLRLRGMTFAEIGEVLGMPLKTVATRNARTLERLRRLVREGHLGDE